MARIGINPARGKVSDYRPARVSLALLSYIPELSGYFSERLKILTLSVASLVRHTPPPYDLLVFDNGSCREVVDFWRRLHDEGAVDYLILSDENIGKIGALRILFSAAPGEIIAYSDDDILFYPGWLPAHLEILEAFPGAGMVSGVPVRNAAAHAHNSLDQLVRNPSPGLKINFERRIPEAWEVDWAASTGRDAQSHLRETSTLLDTVLQVVPTSSDLQSEGVRPVEAIGSANHFQFVARKEIILQALPQAWSGKLMGHMLELDQAVDDMGLLRLSTTTRTTRHLGNALSPQIIQEAKEMGLSVSGQTDPDQKGIAAPSSAKAAPRRRPWILRLPGARRVLAWAYRRLFDVLYR